MDYGFWCFRALCMGFTAYLAHKRGKNPWLWGAMAYPLFLFAPLVLLFVTRQKARSLQQYLAQYPECRTGRGMACAFCNSGSIRLWRRGGLLSNRDQHFCNHCSSYLYDS